MTEQEVIQKLNELKENPETKTMLENAKTKEEVARIFSEHGLPLNVEDVEELFKGLAEFDEELSEEQLENVAGGVWLEVLVGVAISYFWDITPGDNGREKTQYLVDWWSQPASTNKKKHTRAHSY